MLVIPISSELYTKFNEIARSKRLVFMAGLPGVGKSLLIQQLALLATEAGRIVHTFQWDTARAVFETPEWQAHYPESDGVTHPVVRKAVGLWARGAVTAWHDAHPEPEHMLIGEVPLIGNRLIELVQVMEDEAEALLSAPNATFVVPVPSWEVRAVIEKSRERTIAEPQHEKERWDASPDVLRALWREINALARRINLTKAAADAPYNPYIYGGVYKALVRHRHHELLLIDEVLRPAQSVYELDVVAGQLQADPATVKATFQQVVDSYSLAEVEAAVANWHMIVGDSAEHVDPGPEIRLPMPEKLSDSVARTSLSEAQRAALAQIMGMPLEASADTLIPILDEAIAALTGETRPPIITNTHKFDIYDSYFNVSRDDSEDGITFLASLIQAYRNVLLDLAVPPHDLSVVELPMLRIALETTINAFGVGE